MPVALRGLRRLTTGAGNWLSSAALLSAVALTNWVTALALAIAGVVLVIAALGESGFRLWRSAAVTFVSYLLACFWLTPSLVKTVAFNWPADAFGYHLRDTQMWLAAGVVSGALAIRVVFGLLRAGFYFRFVSLCAFVFGYIATVFYLYGVDIIPESRRYALEFE